MVAEMSCYTYLGHIRNPRIYAVPPNYAVFTRFYFHPKNRVKWGEYCTSIRPTSIEKKVQATYRYTRNLYSYQYHYRLAKPIKLID